MRLSVLLALDSMKFEILKKVNIWLEKLDSGLLYNYHLIGKKKSLEGIIQFIFNASNSPAQLRRKQELGMVLGKKIIVEFDQLINLLMNRNSSLYITYMHIKKTIKRNKSDDDKRNKIIKYIVKYGSKFSHIDFSQFSTDSLLIFKKIIDQGVSKQKKMLL